MADLGAHAKMRAEKAQRLIDALGLDIEGPSTKHRVVLQQKFDLTVMEALLARIVALEEASKPKTAAKK